MSQKSKDPSTIKDIFSGLRWPKVVKDHLKNYELWSKWDEIVGIELSRVTQPGDLKQKTLTVSVAHQAWAQQLHFLKASILTKIRAICPDAEIKDLHFKVGMIPVKKPATSSKKDLPKGDIGPLPERLEMTLRAVEDPELRGAIRRAMEAEFLNRQSGAVV
jgi:hypothetical protein